ncbi:hypothetical protein DPEC_G00008870 [Dallia pectoralis]|uniref:Uncharacterized protein n=1 Tax=Dallia pectoralis TaxID=75939 RepID=A0ACC2HLN8_DALPE|nr:hypothetical protein DPEC_G00008870 [Dallia pectoralis]
MTLMVCFQSLKKGKIIYSVSKDGRLLSQEAYQVSDQAIPHSLGSEPLFLQTARVCQHCRTSLFLEAKGRGSTGKKCPLGSASSQCSQEDD